MEVIYTVKPELLAEADLLLYQVLWQPHGLPRDTRRKFPVEGHEYTFVAIEESQIVGCVLVISSKGKDMEFRHAAIAKGYQGEGLGTKLVQYAISYAKSNFLGQRAFVYARDTAIGFWQKQGFRSEDEIVSHSEFSNTEIKFCRLWINLY